MGLLHDVDVVDDGRARIDIMLTSGWCPFQVDLTAEMPRSLQHGSITSRRASRMCAVTDSGVGVWLMPQTQGRWTPSRKAALFIW
jgi:hypothetical protein